MSTDRTAAQRVTRELARHVVHSRWEDLPDAARNEARRSFFNWLACAIGGTTHEAAKKALALAHAYSGPREAAAVGTPLRLDLLHEGFEEMRSDGIPVRSFAPQEAIYLSVQFDLIGRGFSTNEEIRRFLLEHAGFAVVPFQAFGLNRDTGWFRLSVGAVSPEQIREGLARVRAALTSYRS